MKIGLRIVFYQIVFGFHMSLLFTVVIAPGFHLFPFRTEQLSPVAPMILHNCGKVGRRHFILVRQVRTFFCAYMLQGFT